MSIDTPENTTSKVHPSGQKVGPEERLCAKVAAAQRETLDRRLRDGAPDGADAVERWKRRYEVQAPLRRPFTDPSLVASRGMRRGVGESGAPGQEC